MAKRPLFTLADLVPADSGGRVLISVPADTRFVAADFAAGRDVLDHAPEAWYAGPLAGPGAAEARDALREAKAAAVAAALEMRTAREAHTDAYRAAVVGVPSSRLTQTEADTEYTEHVRPFEQASKAADAAHAAAKVALARALFVVSDDLAAARREAYAEARGAAVTAAREAVDALTEAMRVHLAAWRVAADAAGTRVWHVRHGLPAQSNGLAAVIAEVEGMN